MFIFEKFFGQDVSHTKFQRKSFDLKINNCSANQSNHGQLPYFENVMKNMINDDNKNKYPVMHLE